MRTSAWAFGLGATAIVHVVGCIEITTAPDQAVTYHGTWTNRSVKLTLTTTRITYAKSGTRVDTGFKGLAHDDIIYEKNNRLKVSVPPHQEGTVWKMTVEGEVLERQ